MEEPQLTIAPAKKIPFWMIISKDVAQSNYHKPILEYTIRDIATMYEKEEFICDTCGNPLGKINFSLWDHISHLINPLILWSCDNCIEKDRKEGKIIAESSSNSTNKE